MAFTNPTNWIAPGEGYMAAMDAGANPYQAMTYGAPAYQQALWGTYTPEQQQAILAGVNDLTTFTPNGANPYELTYTNGAGTSVNGSINDYLKGVYASTLGRLPTAEERDWYANAWQQGGFAGANGANDPALIAKYVQGSAEAQGLNGNVPQGDALTQYYGNLYNGELPPQTPMDLEQYALKPSGSNLGMTSSGSKSNYTPNPYLEQMSNVVLGQLNDNLTRAVLPQINSAAQLSGQYGGSRQGVVQANALNDMNRQAANAITGMYYGDYTNAKNRELQKYGIDMSAQTAANNLGLGYATLDANIANQNFANQLAGANFGLTAYNTLFNGNTLGLTSAGNVQNMPYTYYNNLAGTAANIGGQGGTSTTNYYSDPWTSAAGGAAVGNSLYNYWAK